ncbi:MAG: dihydroorotate dehydrogenase electron transfer subunit [Smithella sp.]
MAKDIYIGEVLKNEEVGPQYFLMKIALPPAFGEPVPGQFVMIRIAGIAEPFLGRPISIYSYCPSKSSMEIELLFRVVGKGTQILAGLIAGSQVEVHGPLGGSYAVFPEKESIVFIAGGIGVAPLSLLAQYLCESEGIKSTQMNFYLGARTAKEIVGLDKLATLCYNVQICTDDGTQGRKMQVTKAFQKEMKKYDPSRTAVYACGPRAMMKALGAILNNSGFHCQVSLEERMACGTGACMGCAAAIRDKSGNAVYKRVCTDGPVFDLADVIWE